MNLLGEDGYPTDELLEYLRTTDDYADALGKMAEAWWMGDAGGVTTKLTRAESELVMPLSKGERYVRFATCGWSGNESLIDAFEANAISGIVWALSAAGGLHIYRLPGDEEDE